MIDFALGASLLVTGGDTWVYSKVCRGAARDPWLPQSSVVLGNTRAAGLRQSMSNRYCLALQPYRKDFPTFLLLASIRAPYSQEGQWLPRPESAPTQATAGEHENGVLLCCDWYSSSEGQLHWKLLSDNTTVTVSTFAIHLEVLAYVMSQKRPDLNYVYLL